MVLCLSQDGACTDSFENFRDNSLKGGLSNATTFNPPLFSLVDTFKLKTMRKCTGTETKLENRYTCTVFLRQRVVSRVRRSYSLKAKISENVGIFVLALKRKKVCFFALFAWKRNIPNSEKINESELSQK